MSPEEICRRWGAEKTKAIFQELTTEGMKKVLREAKLPTTRQGASASTKKRNSEWAAALWRGLEDKPLTAAAATLLFEWLTKTRRPMLADFLTALGVEHDGGLTEADFMKDSPPEKLIEAANKLLERYERREVAAYLLFLDATNKSEVFKPLDPEKLLGEGAGAPASSPSSQTG